MRAGKGMHRAGEDEEMHTKEKGGESMSEKEKEIIERIKTLPEPLKEAFLQRAEGAAEAVAMMREKSHG